VTIPQSHCVIILLRSTAPFTQGSLFLLTKKPIYVKLYLQRKSYKTLYKCAFLPLGKNAGSVSHTCTKCRNDLCCNNRSRRFSCVASVEATHFLICLKIRKDDFMKKKISILLAFLIMTTQLLVYADGDYVPKGLKATQEQYAKIISAAIEKSEYDEEEIDKEHIFIVEHTSPLEMRKNSETIWLYVALPIVDSSKISYAHFDEGEYVMAITDFAPFNGMEKPYGNKLEQYIKENKLSEPTEITNVWISERVHTFAYNVVCDGEEYIIPYYFTEESLFNITNDEECNIELGKAYTLDEFLTICEKEAELFEDYRKTESEENEKENSAYVDNDGDVVEEKIEKDEVETVKEDEKTEVKEEQTKEIFTFDELTKISAKEIKKISIACSKNGRTEFTTASPIMISNIVNSIKDVQFVEDTRGSAGGWLYGINFYMEDETYIQFGARIHLDKTDYIALEHETAVDIMSHYHDLIGSIDSSEWATDYILDCMELGFFEDVEELNYKDNITREKFCEIVYNMLMRRANNGIAVPSAFYFEDTYNSKVSALYYADIINGKGERIFAPDDYLTREEAATILYRVAEFLEIDMPQLEYDESIPYYEDKEAISEWAFNAVFYMREMGIMVGTSETEFSPKETYTAEQTIATIIRMYSR